MFTHPRTAAGTHARLVTEAAASRQRKKLPLWEEVAERGSAVFTEKSIRLRGVEVSVSTLTDGFSFEILVILYGPVRYALHFIVFSNVS